MALHYNHGKWTDNSSLYFKIGLIISVLFCIILFQTEIHSAAIDPPIEYAPEDLGIITPPPTKHRKKQLPPVKAPEPLEELKEITDEPEFIESESESDLAEVIQDENHTSDELVSFIGTESKQDVILMPEVSEPIDDKVYDFAERMPTFDDCLVSEDESVRRACTNKELLNIVYSRLNYPKIARENGIEGMVIASFTVLKNGEISDIQIIRDIGGGCGQAVIQVLKTIPKMRPGKQNGRPVNVSFKVPVKFKLE